MVRYIKILHYFKDEGNHEQTEPIYIIYKVNSMKSFYQKFIDDFHADLGDEEFDYDQEPFSEDVHFDFSSYVITSITDYMCKNKLPPDQLTPKLVDKIIDGYNGYDQGQRYFTYRFEITKESPIIDLT